MAKLPDVADHRQLMALGYPKREAKRVAKKHNRRAAVDQLPGTIARPGKGGQTKKASPPSPSRIPNGPASSRPSPSGRTAGNPPATKLARQALAAGADPDEVAVMCAKGADPDLRALWLASIAPDDDARTLADDDVSERAAIMAEPGADPALRRMFLAQVAGTEPETASTAPVALDGDYAVDPERLALHKQAEQLAADEKLSYADAAVRILDRQSGAIFS